MELDHVGLVVPHLDDAVGWYSSTFGFGIAWREAETTVDGAALGLPGESARLKGSGLAVGGAYLELHEYLRPVGSATRRTCDPGFGHIAIRSDDIHSDTERLASAGLRFIGPPRLITSGGLAGVRWVYAQDPWGNVIELCQRGEPLSK